MTPEREAELYSTYPRLLIHRPGQGEGLPMQFGIQCGDGWYCLIDRLLRNVQVHADQGGVQPIVLQIKEKLGALRVYWRPADDVVRGMTRLAENLSESTCEVCGHPGALVANEYGGRRTRCEAHRDVTDPDNPDSRQEAEQRPRSRRRTYTAPMPPASDASDQVLVDSALLIASETSRLSVSMLQRRLKIGYSRAERLRDAVLAIASNSNSNPSPQEHAMTQSRIYALKVDADNAAKVFESLKLGEGRFGWSYVESADLRVLQARIQSEGFASLSADEANCYQQFLLRLNPGDYAVYINVPKWGRCTLAKVTSPYYWEWRDDDFNHRFKVDPTSVREFGRNDPFVRPALQARLKLQNRQWQVTAESEFEELLAHLDGASTLPSAARTANLGFLAKDIRPHLAKITEEIQRNHPNYALEGLMASVFESMPRVVDVRLQGGAGDRGADILVTIENGHPLTGEVGQTLCVVQVKSFVDEHWDTQAVDDIRRAFAAYPDAEAGLIVSTAARPGPTLEFALAKLRSDTGKPVNLLIGEEVALFVLRYGAHLLSTAFGVK